MVTGRARRAPMIFDSMRRHLAQELPEPLLATVDLSIKDRVRLLRLPNMIHEKSGLYKVILNAVEIERLTPREIRDLAREPRPLRSTDETGLVSRNHIDANPPGMELFQRVRRQAARLARKPFVYRFHRPDDLSRTDFPCAGMQKIWESHIEAGSRNNCAIRLASEFRLLGLTSDEIKARLCSGMIETASNCRRSNGAALCVRHFKAAFPIATVASTRLCGATGYAPAPLTGRT